MNNAEREITRSFLKNKLYEYVGQAYEDFFVKIMLQYNKNFQAVRAYGNIGDRSNDGYDKTTGTYYQVYAPDDISKRIRKSQNKLNDDFRDLYKYWNDLYEVKNYFFVINDKYKAGVEPEIHKAISELEKEFPTISFNLWFNHHLEDIVLNLPDKKRSAIVFVPDPMNLELDTLGLNMVIKHLQTQKVPDTDYSIPKNPDREKKIVFNKLGDQAANYIRFGSYQKSELEIYFKREADLKEKLRIKFSSLYKEGQKIFDKADDVFSFILKKASPSEEQSIANAVIVLMAMYFETCDIFEEPIEEKSIKINPQLNLF